MKKRFLTISSVVARSVDGRRLLVIDNLCPILGVANRLEAVAGLPEQQWDVVAPAKGSSRCRIGVDQTGMATLAARAPKPSVVMLAALPLFTPDSL